MKGNGKSHILFNIFHRGLDIFVSLVILLLFLPFFPSSHIPYYMDRHAVKPGLTGWAQVTGWRGDTPELWMMEGRVIRDIWYIEHRSIWLDIKIIFLTVGAVLFPAKGAPNLMERHSLEPVREAQEGRPLKGGMLITGQS